MSGCLFYLLTVAELEEKTSSALQSARKKIRFEITELNERLKQSKDTIVHFKDEIKRLEDSEFTREKVAS